MRNPFTPLFLMTLAMLWGVYGLNLEPEVVGALILVVFPLALGLFFLKRRRAARAAIFLSLSLLVCWRFAVQWRHYQTAIGFVFPRDEYISVEGPLTDFPEIRQDGATAIMEVSTWEYRERSFPPPVKGCLLRLIVNGEIPILNRGDWIRAEVVLSPVRPPGNFFPDSMSQYSLSRGMALNGYCKSGLLVRKRADGPVAWRILGDWRQKIRHEIETKYLETAGDGEKKSLNRKGVLLEAVILGDRGRLAGEDKEYLIETGVLHLLAISGAHIGVIALLFLWILKKAGVSLRIRYTTTAAAILLFLGVSGFKISAERAVWMALLLFAAKMFHQEVNTFNIIFAAAFFLLVRNPAQFLDAGYNLTVFLTAAIVAGRKLFMPMFSEKSRIPVWLRELTSVNLAPFLVAWPLSLFYFKRFSLAGLWMGMALAPALTSIIAVSVMLIPLSLFWPAAAQGVLYVANWPLELFFFLVEKAGERSDALNIYAASPPLWLTAGLISLLFIASNVHKKSWRTISLSLMFAGLIVISLPLFPYRTGRLEVFFLDVGQGDAQVIVFPEGEALLLDGGGSHFTDSRVGRNTVAPFLLQKRIRPRWFAVSHFHPDHCAGVAELIPIFRPEAIWTAAQHTSDPWYRAFMESAENTPVLKKKAGQWLEIAGCRVEFLAPEFPVFAEKAENNHSMVMRIADSTTSFLFPGDIESPVEASLVQKYGSAIRSDVVKAPHHGSRTSSSQAFINAVKPDWVVFSCREPNRYGFPHADVVRRYRSQKTRFLSTGQRGAVHFTSSPSGLSVETDH